MGANEISHLLPPCIKIAKLAGDKILEYWGKSDLGIIQKSDKTPVTAADLAAHEILYESLYRLTPDLPILSEEGSIPNYSERCRWNTYWILDPLDGTRGFVRGSSEFTVNIALIVKHKPMLGIIYAPVTKIIYYATYQGGSFKQVSDNPPQILKLSLEKNPIWKIAVGQFHRVQKLENVIPKSWKYSWLRMNSSLKFGALAEGKAHIYIRFGPTCEWDIAAGQCILEEVGGLTVDLTGQPLKYNCKSSLLNPNFIALSNPAFISQWLEILTSKD